MNEGMMVVQDTAGGSSQHRPVCSEPSSAGRTALAGRNSTRGKESDDSGRNRKSTTMLLAVSISFFIYLTPLLSLMLYIRILHLVQGTRAAIFAFLNLCTVGLIEIF